MYISRLLVSGFKTQTSAPPNPGRNSCIVQLHVPGPGLTMKGYNMSPKDINKTIERLDDQDWNRMKEHMDKKCPSMTLPTVEDFKDLVKLYGKFKEYEKKKFN